MTKPRSKEAPARGPDTTLSLLQTMLPTAVLVSQGNMLDKDDAFILGRAVVCGQYIASHGDELQFKSKTPGRTGAAFAHLAEGLACATLVLSDGFDWLGIRFELPVAWRLRRLERVVKINDRRLDDLHAMLAQFAEACGQLGGAP